MSDTFNAKLLLDLSSALKCVLVAVVPDGNIGTSLRKRPRNCKANSSASSGNDRSPSFQREQWHDLSFAGGDRIVLGENALAHGVVHYERSGSKTCSINQVLNGRIQDIKLKRLWKK